jgi:hypothetical protein
VRAKSPKVSTSASEPNMLCATLTISCGTLGAGGGGAASAGLDEAGWRHAASTASAQKSMVTAFQRIFFPDPS